MAGEPHARLVLQRCSTVAGSGTFCHSQRRIILGTWLPAESSVSVRSSLGVPSFVSHCRISAAMMFASTDFSKPLVRARVRVRVTLGLSPLGLSPNPNPN